MRDLIYTFILWIARVHDHVLSINDSGGWYFDDKQLHFIVMGLFGMLLIFIIYPIFKLLANTGHTMVIAWLYVFTLVLVLSFAIEIAQWYSGTGVMEREDISYGLAGFFVMFIIFAILRGLYHAIKSMFKKNEERSRDGSYY